MSREANSAVGPTAESTRLNHVAGAEPVQLDEVLSAMERALVEQGYLTPDFEGPAVAITQHVLASGRHATIDIVEALTARPAAAQFVVRLGRMLGLEAGALMLAKDLVDHAQDDPFLLDALSESLLAAGDYVLALDAVERLRDKYPSIPIPYDRRAEILFAKAMEERNSGRSEEVERLLEDASADLDRALELGPEVASTRLTRARVRHFLGDSDGAAAEASRAIELGATAEGHNLRGAISEDHGKFADALGDYEVATELAPAWPTAWRNRADAELALDRLDEAAAHYLEAFTLDPEDVDARIGLARAHLRLGKAKLALDVLQPVAGTAVDTADARNLRGLALVELALQAEDEGLALAQRAVDELDVALQDMPTASPALFNRARALYLLGEHESAITDCDAAAAVDITNPEIFFLRAVIRSNLVVDAQARDDPDEAARLGAVAIADYDEGARLAPNDVRMHLFRAELQAVLQRWDLAHADYSRALEIQPDLPAALLGRGSAAAQMGDLRAALDDLGRALQNDPDNTALLTRRGLVHASLADEAQSTGRAGDLTREVKLALADYDAAIAVDPENVDAHLHRGALLAFKGAQLISSHRDARASRKWLRRARDAFSAVLRLRPAHASAYVYRAVTEHRMGDLDAALVDYDRAIEHDPTLTEAFTGRGILREDMGEYDTALADYERAAQLSPGDPEAWRNIGDALLGLSQAERAAEAYGEAIERSSSWVEGYVGRARARSMADQTELAIRDLDTAVSLQPDNPRLYVQRADEFASIQDYESAAWDYDRALMLDPDDQAAYRGRALARLQLGISYSDRRHFDRGAKTVGSAIDDAERAIELDEADPWAHRYHAYALRTREAFDRAVDAFKRAAERAPDDQFRTEVMAEEAEAFRLWGHGLNDRQVSARAVDAFDAVLKDADDNEGLAWVHGSLGEALTDAGELARALGSFRRALELDPGNARARVAMGIALLFLGDTERARVELERSLPEGAEDAGAAGWARVGLGVALRRLGQLGGARAALRAALTGPLGVRHTDRSVWLDEVGEGGMAIADARTGVSRAPELSETHNQLAWLLTIHATDRRRIADAVSHGRRAVEIATTDYDRARCLDTLGWALFKSGALDEAVRFLSEAVRVDSYDLLLRRHLEEAQEATVDQ